MTLPQGWSRPRTDDELRAALQRQVGHLRRSAKAYDEGFVEEAERLASCVYILLHHSSGKRGNKALLQSSGLLGQMRFPDSRVTTYRAGLPLCFIDPAKSETEYLPRFEEKGLNPSLWLAFRNGGHNQYTSGHQAHWIGRILYWRFATMTEEATSVPLRRSWVTSATRHSECQRLFFTKAKRRFE